MNDKYIKQKYIIEFDCKSSDLSGKVYYRVAKTVQDWLPEETVKKLPPLEKDYIMGYPVEELVIFASACRKQGISNDQLRDFVLNLRTAYEIIMAEVRDSTEAVLNATIKQRGER